MRTLLGSAFGKFMKSQQEEPPTSLRYNPDKLTVTQGTGVPWCSTGRYLEKRPSFTLDPAFHGGAYYVQEASSMFLEQAIRQSVDLSKPLAALDLCAAPGGKSTHLLSLLSNDSLVVSNDAIRTRVPALIENIERWGKCNAIITNNDPADFQRLPPMFDIVIVDAPCSGEGLFRKDPEAHKQWSPKNVELCSLRQRRIIQDIWDVIKPDGILIYSTCTYNDQENIANLLWLQTEYDLEFVSLTIDPSWGVEVKEKGPCIGYQFYPHLTKGEGFFLSVLRKKDGAKQHIGKTRDNLKYPTARETAPMRDWIIKPPAQCFFLHNRQVRMIPALRKAELQLVLDRLHVIEAGTAVAEIAHNKLIPEHALAQSVNLRKDAFRRIQLTKDQALDYLRKDLIIVDIGATGFGLMEFEGIGLGWVNILSNRINNLYPSPRRIRKGRV